jgi:hypothetical protein
MRKHYTSLSEAMTDLKARGYINDFNLKGDCIECPAFRLRLTPEHFTVDEYYRFEGMSSVDDNSIVFAIKSDKGIKGILVDAYGVYASNMSDNMIRRLAIAR